MPAKYWKPNKLPKKKFCEWTCLCGKTVGRILVGGEKSEDLGASWLPKQYQFNFKFTIRNYNPSVSLTKEDNYLWIGNNL